MIEDFEAAKEIGVIKSCWDAYNALERSRAIKNSKYNPLRYVRGEEIEKNYKYARKDENKVREGEDVARHIKKKSTGKAYFIHRALEPFGKHFYRHKGQDNIIEDIWYHLSLKTEGKTEKEQKKEGLKNLIKVLGSYKETKNHIPGILEHSGIIKRIGNDYEIKDVGLCTDDRLIAEEMKTNKKYRNYFELFDDIGYVKHKRLGPVRSWMYRHPHLTSFILLNAGVFSAYYFSKDIQGFVDRLKHISFQPVVSVTPTPTIPVPTTPVATTPVATTPVPTLSPTPEIHCPTNISLSKMYNSSYIQHLTFDRPPGVEIVAIKDNSSSIILSQGINDATITVNTQGEHNVSVFSKIEEKLSDLCKFFNWTIEKLPEPVSMGDSTSGGSAPSSASSAPPAPGRRGRSVG